MTTASVATIPVDPLIDPADLVQLLPELDEDAAERAVLVASLVVTTYLYPCPVPDPLPLPVYTATLALAARAASASANAGGALVSESIGSYSYHLAEPLSADGALEVPREIGRMLDPYSCGPGGAFDVSVLGTPVCWPVDWWQRDLDSIPYGPCH